MLMGMMTLNSLLLEDLCSGKSKPGIGDKCNASLRNGQKGFQADFIACLINTEILGYIN